VNPAFQLPAATRTSVAAFPQLDAGLTLEWDDFSAYTKDGGNPLTREVLLWRGDQRFSSTAVPWLALDRLLSFRLSSTGFSNNTPFHNPHYS